VRTIKRHCLDCHRLTSGTRCAACERRYRLAYNTRPAKARARATIAASPRCEQCGSTRDLTADHLIPVTDGHGKGPLRVLCRSCNSSRGSRPVTSIGGRARDSVSPS
jgi:5-methylcytosine-specific restriction endonuclease McrA